MALEPVPALFPDAGRGGSGDGGSGSHDVPPEQPVNMAVVGPGAGLDAGEGEDVAGAGAGAGPNKSGAGAAAEGMAAGAAGAGAGGIVACVVIASLLAAADADAAAGPCVSCRRRSVCGRCAAATPARVATSLGRRSLCVSRSGGSRSLLRRFACLSLLHAIEGTTIVSASRALEPLGDRTSHDGNIVVIQNW